MQALARNSLAWASQQSPREYPKLNKAARLPNAISLFEHILKILVLHLGAVGLDVRLIFKGYHDFPPLVQFLFLMILLKVN